MSSKKVLIQEISSKEFIANQEQSQQMEEEEQTQPNTQQIHQVVSGTINTDSNKAVKKDLLRLEKNYFDNIYNQEKHQNEKQFVVSKMINQNPASLQKPDFRSLPKSSLKDKLNSFLPSFKKDTDDLLVNQERQEQLRIDDRNQYDIEVDNSENQSDDDDEEDAECEVEENQIQADNMMMHDHQQNIISLKRKQKEQQKNKKNKNVQEDPNQPKMIELDMLLGVLEQKDPQEQQNDIQDEENNEMNVEQDSNHSDSNNNNKQQNIKIQEINE